MTDDRMAPIELIADQRLHRRVPSQEAEGRPTPERNRRTDKAESEFFSRVENVFGARKTRIDLIVRTIDIARTTTEIPLYNIRRLLFIRRRAAA
ncbi:hypothetical protein EYW49_22070 [Siculibacillus lacustris]|uniref:Uncharacterized protein n=1 Tax=Siculibacillus lacustris TaxID=1549641 RepID=A0A4Q9VD76_9HYPH|nr:hypothetical protein [Siculibacillus lacustris]TBW32426.1 hypothetical protein EYW49_22070 [Siculibacillus lacustris]